MRFQNKLKVLLLSLHFTCVSVSVHSLKFLQVCLSSSFAFQCLQLLWVSFENFGGCVHFKKFPLRLLKHLEFMISCFNNKPMGLPSPKSVSTKGFNHSSGLLSFMFLCLVHNPHPLWFQELSSWFLSQILFLSPSPGYVLCFPLPFPQQCMFCLV